MLKTTRLNEIAELMTEQVKNTSEKRYDKTAYQDEYTRLGGLGIYSSEPSRLTLVLTSEVISDIPVITRKLLDVASLTDDLAGPVSSIPVSVVVPDISVKISSDFLKSPMAPVRKLVEDALMAITECQEILQNRNCSDYSLSLQHVDKMSRLETDEVISIASSHAQQKELVYVVSDDKSLKLRCSLVGSKCISPSVATPLLTQVARYYTDESEILCREEFDDPDAINWGTLLPISDYLELWEQTGAVLYWSLHYTVYYDIIQDVISGKSQPQSIPIEGVVGTASNECVPVGSLKITKELFKSTVYEQDTKQFYTHSMVSSNYMSDDDAIYDAVEKMFRTMVDDLQLLDDSDEVFNTFLFRMTGRRLNSSAADSFRPIRFKSDSTHMYYWARQVNRSSNHKNVQLANGVYERTYAFFTWKDRPLRFASRTAAKEAVDNGGQLTSAYKDKVSKLGGQFWE